MNACAECIRLLEHKAGWLEFRAHLAEHRAERCPECGGRGYAMGTCEYNVVLHPCSVNGVPCPRGCEVKHE